MILPFLIIAGSFLLGSIPFALLLGCIVGKKDIRRHGSGNVGATNLGRVCGWHYFPAAFALDFAKGFLPSFLFSRFHRFDDASTYAPLLFSVAIAFAPVLGHIFSPFLRFRGGKGVATGAGAMTSILPAETGIAFVVWLAVLAVTRTVGPSSCAASLALPASFFLLSRRTLPEYLCCGALTTLLALLVLYRHKRNLKAYFSKK